METEVSTHQQHYSEVQMSEQAEPQTTPAEATAPEAPPAAEATPAVEAKAQDEAPKTEETPPESPPVDIFGEDVPSWLKEFDGRDKPFKVTKEQMESLPTEAKQLVHNLRKMAMDKTRAASEFKKGLGETEKTLAEKEAAIKHERAKLYKVFQSPELQELLKPPEGEAPPAYTVDGQEWAAKKLVSDMMTKIIGKMGELSEGANNEYRRTLLDQKVEVRKSELTDFSQQHADFLDYREHIIEYRKTHPDVRSEDVYYILKARDGSPVQPKPSKEEEVKAARLASRSKLSQTYGTSAQTSQAGPPKGLSAREKADWYSNNPDAMNQILREVRGR